MNDYGHLFNAAVADELQAQRARKHATVAELVTATGISKSQMLRLLNAKVDIDTRDIALICRALNAQPAEIIQRAQDEMAKRTQGTTQQD